MEGPTTDVWARLGWFKVVSEIYSPDAGKPPVPKRIMGTEMCSPRIPCVAVERRWWWSGVHLRPASIRLGSRFPARVITFIS
jgi:hypothetical protein